MPEKPTDGDRHSGVLATGESVPQPEPSQERCIERFDAFPSTAGVEFKPQSRGEWVRYEDVQRIVREIADREVCAWEGGHQCDAADILRRLVDE